MRLIDADALFQDLKEHKIPFNADINEAIIVAPTIDAAPVVRCKDCVYGASGANEYDSWEYCYWFDHEIDGNEFCSYGERRDGDMNG